MAPQESAGDGRSSRKICKLSIVTNDILKIFVETVAGGLAAPYAFRSNEPSLTPIFASVLFDSGHFPMCEKDIYCGIHYPVPVHLQDAYNSLGIKNGNCPVAEKCAQEYVSLPMFPELDDEQIEYVVQEIKNSF